MYCFDDWDDSEICFLLTANYAQASQGDISVGLYSWAHNLLPVVSSKSCNPQSRDLILQLVERWVKFFLWCPVFYVMII